MSAAARLAAVAAILAGAVWASPATAAPAPARSTLRLAGQTAVVTGSGTWRLVVDATGAPPGAHVAVVVGPSLHSRSAFDQAAAGRGGGGSIYTRTAPIDAGAAEVDIPINPVTPDIEAFRARGGSSVYPVQVRLLDGSGAPLGASLTTFLVYSTGPNAYSPALAVALTVPVAGPAGTTSAPTRLAPPDSARLAALAAPLAAAAGTPVTLAVSPDSAARLAAGTGADARTLALLSTAVAGGDQLLSEPYLPLDLGALHAAGLDDVVAASWEEGDATLRTLLHAAPDRGSAALPGGTDPTSVGVLTGLGVSRLALPAADLPPLPDAAQRITYARPTLLATRGAPIPVVTDDALSALLAGGADPQLAAAHLLAGLAMVQLEAPSVARGVALEVPAGQATDPATLSAVLAGVAGDPFVRAVTLAGLFRAVAPGSPPITRSLAEGRPPAPLPLAGELRASRAAVAALAAIVPGRASLTAPLQRQLLVAASDAVGTAGRRQLLAEVDQAVGRAERGVSLPGSSSVTLTGRQGTIPLTVLSTPSEVVRVALRLRSTKLGFRPWSPAGGRCSATGSVESCQLTLDAEATTYRVPVEARTGGVFGLDVVLTSPDGSITLAHDRDTVRSTAFSDVGVVLIVAAGLGLAWWWVRNIRHGRRARQLVDPATGEVPVVDVAGAPPPPRRPPPPPAPQVGPTADDPHFPAFPGDDDPVIADFFANPPPRWGEVSPSGPPPGPTT